MANPQTILLAGGGTGGHLYPGIAVARALVANSSHIKPLFLCTARELDRAILEPTGFEFVPQPIVPMVKSVGGLLRFWKGWRETTDLVRKILQDRSPAGVIGLGGYAAGVAVKAASKAGMPSIILNPDVMVGKANNYLMSYVSAVCAGWDATVPNVAQAYRSKVRVTGCPIRQDIRSLPPRDEAAKRLGLNPILNTLVITGASQGAQTVNEAVLEAVRGMSLAGWQILHLSGKDHAAAVRQGYRDMEVEALVIDFTPAMADVWSVATVVVSRAGASSCAELCACRLPSILFPYPYHKDMHQRANGKVLSTAGAAVLLDDQKDRTKNGAALKPVLEMLINDAKKRDEMSAAAEALARPDAADAVAQVMMELLPSNR